jgi:hypothetical protein
MKTNESIEKNEEFYSVTKLELNKFKVYDTYYYDYKFDFSEVRKNDGILGKKLGQWKPVDKTEQEILKDNFKEIEKRVVINLEEDPSYHFMEVYKKWAIYVGKLVNHKTGWIEKIIFHPLNHARTEGYFQYLVRFDEQIKDPVNPGYITGYHFKKDEVVFL